MPSRRRLLVVDDEPAIGDFICELAFDAGFDAHSITNAGEFEQVYDENTHVVVLDLFMPGRDGIELLRVLSGLKSKSAIILISGYDKGVLNSAKKLAAEQGLFVAGTLTKPFQYDQIRHLLNTLALSSVERSSVSGLIPAESISEEDLKEAIESGQLRVFFQPQIEINSGKVTGVEALVRWQHPVLGIIDPINFIPLAEQTGLVDLLTEEVLEQSLKQASEWLAKGLRLNVSINMPPTSFRTLDLPEIISKKITDYGLQLNQVTLEVTETTLMQELTRSLDILTRLRMKGILLSIDDFGTGYSSMVQLYRIPFTELKIDLSFVKKATSDKEALAIVKMVTMLGHELGMTVVAEGVEDKETWELLRELGCDTVQGYYMARPMASEEVLPWFEQYNQNAKNVVNRDLCTKG